MHIMKVFKTTSPNLTYISDDLKPSEANLDYNYSLNRYCVDLKYVPTFNNYPVKVDYYIYPETYTITQPNLTYFLGDGVRKIYLPSNPKLNDSVTLVNIYGWGVKVMSICNDLFIDYETFTYLEFKFCGDSWQITKKGSHAYSTTSNKVYYIHQVQSTSLMDVVYNPRVIGHGYLNFANIYELYTLGIPVELDKIIRYSNNTIEFLGADSVLGPINSVITTSEPSNEFVNFETWKVLVNNTDVSGSVLERLRLKFSPFLKFEMPQVSAMLRDVYVKFINSVTNTPDPVYTLGLTDTLVEVYNLTRDQLMVESVDYVLALQDNLYIVPTSGGSIYHNDSLLISVLGDNFIS